MDTVVVGFDGTAPSVNALEWAAHRAAKHIAQIRIVTVAVAAEDPLLDAGAGGVQQAQAIAPAVEIVASHVIGKMPQALLDAAAGATLLVIGAHRQRPVRAALAGWPPLRLASRAEGPVVVVPEDWSDSAGPVLVGIDDDDSSARAVQFAAGEADRLGLPLLLLHAWQMPSPTTDGAFAYLASPLEQKTVHRRILDDLRSEVRAQHPELIVEAALVQGAPSGALLSEARRCSLMVIGTHRRSLLEGALLGSVAQDTLRGSRIPVCVVPS
ncbi:universal stress protein [Microbacterium sp. NPDC076911]|uniref:universal stress protein n=1 Tax=Microbacterium sp. NPDC076911 TaxID=3154958 RepID=UPI003415F76F